MKPKVIPWTADENDRLKAFALSGKSVVLAAAVFKRTTLSVRNQARKLGTPFVLLRDTKKRMRALTDPGPLHV
jgi:hypothetical protein